MERQRIEQRPPLVAMGRMDEHSGGFVYDNEMTVFEDDVERNVLGQHRGLAREVEMDLDEVTDAQTTPDILVLTVYLALLVANDLAKIHPAEIRKTVEQKILEPHIALVLLHDELLSFHREDSKRCE